MKIDRHCTERLPGGERLWRRMAREAGFDGTLRVHGYFRRNLGDELSAFPWSASYWWGRNTIEVCVPSRCSQVPRYLFETPDPLVAYAHELGHHQQQLRGDIPQWRKKRPMTHDEWHEDWHEKDADDYAARLLRKFGIEP